MKELKDDAKVTEEREYARASEGDDGLIEVLLNGKEILARLKARITIILRKREQIALQATRTAIQENLSLQTSSFQPGNVSASNIESSIRLPKLQLPNFDGNILRWPEFWDIYESSVHRQDIPKVVKYSYLKGVLRGSAASAITGVSITNEGYDVAIRILQEKFGNKEAIVEALYAKLQRLPTASNKFGDIKYTHDVIEKLLRQLESQGEMVNQQRMLIHQLLSKFPLEVIVKLEDVKRCDQAWTMQLLRKLLSQYVMIQENAERRVSNIRGGSLQGFQGRQINRSPVNRGPVRSGNNQTPDQSCDGTFAVDVQRKAKGTPRNPCLFCQGQHFNDECEQYKLLADRKQRLLSLGRCFLCFKTGHTFRECPLIQRSVCYYCGKRGHHNRAICPEKFGDKHEEKERVEKVLVTSEVSERSPDNTKHVQLGDNTKLVQSSDNTKHVQLNQPVNSTSVNFEQALVTCGERVLLQTATVPIQATKGSETIMVKVLLDSASHCTFMTDRLAKQLQLKSERKELLSISTFAARGPQEVSTYVVHFYLITKDGSCLSLHANVINQITGPIKRGPLQSSDMDFLLLIAVDKLADTIPGGSESDSIDLLIGSDYFWTIVGLEKLTLPSGLHLVSSKIGYILTGKYMDSDNDKSSSQQQVSTCFVMTQVNCTVPEMNLLSSSDISVTKNPNIEDFWSLETIGITDSWDVTDDDKALEQFNELISFRDGRYQVAWPWKCQNPNLPVNLDIVIGRMRSLSRRLQGNPDLFRKYDDIIQGQVEKGIIEKVTENMKENDRKHYLPHHPVITPTKSTTKVRIVYDALAKGKKGDKSLNECLYKGPNLLPDLCGILFRFRTQPIAIFSDIEKAFLQIGIRETDRDVTRFFWFKDSSNLRVTESNLDTYRFCRVPFGVVCSPFLLGGTIKFHLRKTGTPVALEINNNIYVDNVSLGANSVDEAYKIYLESKEIFRKASMNLREWVSNSFEFLDLLPKNEVVKGESVKVFGIHWNRVEDYLQINGVDFFNLKIPPTKREVLRIIARIFDPLGLVTPVTYYGKLFLQDLWKEGFLGISHFHRNF